MRGVIDAAKMDELEAQLDAAVGGSDLARMEALHAAAVEMIRGYRGLLERVRLAENTLQRVRNLGLDARSEIERNAKKSPPIETSGRSILRMVEDVVDGYVEPIQPMLLEALGSEYPAAPGWYLAAEGARAKLVGNTRAKERLEHERLHGPGSFERVRRPIRDNPQA